MDKACENSILLYLATTSTFIGWSIGVIVIGWLSDRYIYCITFTDKICTPNCFRQIFISGLKQVRVSSGNIVPSPSTENQLFSLSELEDRK